MAKYDGDVLGKAAQALYEKQAQQSNWTVTWAMLCPMGKKLRVEQVKVVLEAVNG